ncbi:MAG: TetR/AcrR family transcriptional regulator [Leeuwenhoekiella sp.]
MDLLNNIRITINQSLYLKDPETTDLGRRIVEDGILLIDEVGFEKFTFRKLGVRINSNESSIYRYFENKHKFLLYLASWYWGWMEYRLVFATHNLPDPKEKLVNAIKILTRKVEQDSTFTHINEVMLHTIIINEYSKSYLTKEMDRENKEGYFAIYKRLVERLKNMIIQVNGSYGFPASLASTLIEGSLHQHFLRDHFTSLTDCADSRDNSAFFTNMILNVLNPSYV